MNELDQKARKAVGNDKRRISELEKLVEMQQEQIESLSRKRFKIQPAGRVKHRKGSFTRVVIPDTHGAHVDPEAIGSFLGDLARLAPREIVWLGDHLDCGGWLAQHHTMGFVAETKTTFQEDVDAANDLLDRVAKLCPGATQHYLEGNHECLTPDTDVLTDGGWKPISEVTTSDVVATMNARREVEWQQPTAVHKSWFEGDLVVCDRPGACFSVTPNHRVYHWSQDGKRLLWRRAGEMVNFSSYRVPTSADSVKPEYPISDDRLRLLAWLLTDGCISKGVRIHQSKEEYLQVIRDVIDANGIEYTEGTRLRVPTPPIVTAKTAYVFRMAAGSARGAMRELFGIENYSSGKKYRKPIPAFVHELSQRQFAVFFESIMDGDGTRIGKAYCLYGKREFLEEMQSLCVVNGYRASLSFRNRSKGEGYFCLNVTERTQCRIEGGDLRLKPYAGNVHCLTTGNENFFVRHKGRVHVTGNSRLEKWCVTTTLRSGIDAEMLRKLCGCEYRLQLAQRGIGFYRRSEKYFGLKHHGVIKLGHCYFVHGNSTAKYAAGAMLDKYGGNVVFGHTHRADEASRNTVANGLIKAWSPGCLCLLQPLWMDTNPTNWNHGYGVQLVQPDGAFLHINVPIIDGRSYLLPFVERFSA